MVPKLKGCYFQFSPLPKRVCDVYELTLDNLSKISRSSLEDHLEKLEERLRHLCNGGLKVNAKKLTFSALEMEYLEYILTRDGIKPQSNKVLEVITVRKDNITRLVANILWEDL